MGNRPDMKGVQKKVVSIFKPTGHEDDDDVISRLKRRTDVVSGRPLYTLPVHMPELDDICENCNGVIRGVHECRDNHMTEYSHLPSNKVAQPTYWKVGNCYSFDLLPLRTGSVMITSSSRLNLR